MKFKNMNRSITYAVYGMMEYVLTLRVFGHFKEIRFTGGSMSGYGMRPATYTTDNEALQHLIEYSDAFRSGKVKKLNSQRVCK